MSTFPDADRESTLTDVRCSGYPVGFLRTELVFWAETRKTKGGVLGMRV